MQKGTAQLLDVICASTSATTRRPPEVPDTLQRAEAESDLLEPDGDTRDRFERADKREEKREDPTGQATRTKHVPGPKRAVQRKVEGPNHNTK